VIPPLPGERWTVVAEEEVLPADAGCRVDHRGLLLAALDAGVAVQLLVPTPRPLDVDAYAALLPGVDVLALPRDRRHRRQLSPRPFVVTSRPIPGDLVPAVAAHAPTAVLAMSVRVAHLGLHLAGALRLPLMVRCQNLDSAYFRDLATGARRLRRAAYLVESVRLARFERSLDADPRITAFSDVSAVEAEQHRGRTSTPVVHVPVFALPPDAIPALGTRPAGPDRAGVVFVGSLDVETNQRALDWFLSRVWPQVRATAPTATLAVVGRRPPDTLRARLGTLVSQGVSVYADVPDVLPYLLAAAVAVNPVRTGTGINVKLLQSVLAGCASVSTTVGASGLDWRDGRDLLVADSPPDFAASVLALLADPARRDRLAAAGAALVADRLDPQRCVLSLAEALRPAQAPQSAR